MRKLLLVLILFFILIYLNGSSCKEKTTYEGDAIAPEKIQLISHSQEDDSFHPVYLIHENESGIGSDSDNKGILITWKTPTLNEDGSPIKDLAGFHLYKSRFNDSLNVPHFDEEDSLLAILYSNEYSFLDTNVEIDTRYYYNIFAFDNSEIANFSVPSDTVDYQLIEKPILISPTNNITLDSLPTFRWGPPSGGDVAFYYYFVKVFNETGNIVWKSRPFFSQDSLITTYGDSGSVALPDYENSIPSGKYLWKVNAVKTTEPNTGSTSRTRTFLIL